MNYRGALFLLLLSLLPTCAARPISGAGAVELRLNIVERGLCEAQRDIDSEILDAGTRSTPWLDAREKSLAAKHALSAARISVARWAAGDGREVEDNLRELRHRLESLRGATRRTKMSDPPGLYEALAPLSEPEVTNDVAYDFATGARRDALICPDAGLQMPCSTAR